MKKLKKQIDYKDIIGKLVKDKPVNSTPFNMAPGVTKLIDSLQQRLKQPYGNRANKKSDKLLLKWIKMNKRFYGYSPDPYLHAIVLHYLKTEKGVQND